MNDPRRRDIDFNLLHFIKCVERGDQPPEWLMEFMAEGAREFLRDGKPWQKGQGGRPQASGPPDRIAFVLHRVGGMNAAEVAEALGEIHEDGRDRIKTIRRRIKRGQKDFGAGFLSIPFPPYGINDFQFRELRLAIAEILMGGKSNLSRFPEARRRIEKMRDDIEAAEAEWSQETRYE